MPIDQFSQVDIKHLVAELNSKSAFQLDDSSAVWGSRKITFATATATYRGSMNELIEVVWKERENLQNRKAIAANLEVLNDVMYKKFDLIALNNNPLAKLFHWIRQFFGSLFGPDRTQMLSEISGSSPSSTLLAGKTSFLNKVEFKKDVHALLNKIENVGKGVYLPHTKMSDEEKKNLTKNKETLLTMALSQFGSSKEESTQALQNELDQIEIYGLQKRKDFQLNDLNALPAHFMNSVRNDGLATINHLKGLYEYNTAEPSSSDSEVFWVDFSNIRLGGGVFDHGFVQEEVMVTEMPALAAIIASDEDPTYPSRCYLRTRQGANTGVENLVLGGSPSPLLIKGVTRNLKIDLYGNSDTHGICIKTESLKEHVKFVDQKDLNILAIAAPKLNGKNKAEQFHVNTIFDLYNTVFAGFSVAKASAEKNGKICRIHTGHLGCGAFNNDPLAVYFVQRLAAHQLGIKLSYYDYKKIKHLSSDLSQIILSIVDAGKNNVPINTLLMNWAKNKQH